MAGKFGLLGIATTTIHATLDIVTADIRTAGLMPSEQTSWSSNLADGGTAIKVKLF